jgi:triacylglycerol lipase
MAQRTDIILAVYLPKLYKFLEFFGLETGAFSQLTRKYMRDDFNPKTPDVEGIR